MKRREHTTTYNASESIDTLPESPELERAVLGALILEPAYLPDVRAIIGNSAFLNTNNGKIFEVLAAMDDEQSKIDLITLLQRCRQIPEIEHPAVYLTQLTQCVGSGANVLNYAQQLKEVEIRRRLCLFGRQLAARAAADPDGVIDWATAEITAISSDTVRARDIATLSDVLRSTLDRLEQRQKARQSGACVGVPTGLLRLDAITGGWRGGQLIVLAGRPAMGKSAVMLHFSSAAAASGVPVCIFSLEMPNDQLAGRMLVGGSNVSAGAFRVGNIDTNGWYELEQTGAKLSLLPVYLNDKADVSMSTIRAQCKTMQRQGQCGMVVIDYLQLLDTSSRNTSSTREREIATASRAAKLLAKELDVPVIMLSQLSRKVEERTDKTPLLSDLRESGAIEQDADIVAFIDRPAVYGVQTINTNRYGPISSDGVGVLHIAKNREGATGRIYFRHNDSLTQITDFEPEAASTRENPF